MRNKSRKAVWCCPQGKKEKYNPEKEKYTTGEMVLIAEAHLQWVLLSLNCVEINAVDQCFPILILECPHPAHSQL